MITFNLILLTLCLSLFLYGRFMTDDRSLLDIEEPTLRRVLLVMALPALALLSLWEAFHPHYDTPQPKELWHNIKTGWNGE